MVLHIKTGLKHLKDDKLYEAFRDTIEDAFRARRYSIVPGFFESLENEQVAYIVLDTIQNGSVGGVMLALHQEADDEMKSDGLDAYVVIDKIAVSPERWGNGTLADLMYAAKAIESGKRKKGIPTIWRTSDADISRKYEAHSEFGNSPAIISNYFVHGFGFSELANGADPRYIFEHVASLAAAKPATIIKAGISSYQQKPLENIVQLNAHQHT
ncbi:hypothetical protein HYU50_04830 [Candidatus Woesearchaeota archaeon]|nr:hypothetical protein [Candidatus Woesearchaeota archaeon]